MKFRNSVARLFMLALVWLSALLILHYGFLGAAWDNWARMTLSVLVFTGGLIISDVVLRGRSATLPDVKPSRRATPVGPEALQLREMMALLNDDDLDDLRGEVREGLRERIRRLSASDVKSFDDLLADTSGKRKRGLR